MLSLLFCAYLFAYIASREHDQLCLKYLVKDGLWDFPVYFSKRYHFVSPEKQQLLKDCVEQTENVHQLPSGPMEVTRVREEGILIERQRKGILKYCGHLNLSPLSDTKEIKTEFCGVQFLGMAVSKTDLNSQWQSILPEDWDRRVEAVQNDITSCCY